MISTTVRNTLVGTVDFLFELEDAIEVKKIGIVCTYEEGLIVVDYEAKCYKKWERFSVRINYEENKNSNPTILMKFSEHPHSPINNNATLRELLETAIKNAAIKANRDF